MHNIFFRSANLGLTFLGQDRLGMIWLNKNIKRKDIILNTFCTYFVLQDI